MSSPVEYHLPVLPTESIEGLNIVPDGIYADLTFGGGGHSRLIMDELGPKGKLFGFDQDPDARANAAEFNTNNFKFIAANFRHFAQYLRLEGVTQVDGILADLGVASHQFDTAERGFSIRFDGPLDMRMNPQEGIESVADIINNRTAKQLSTILRKFGEVHNANKLADALVAHRLNQPFNTTTQLRDVAERFAPFKDRNKYLAQVFQAFRIEANAELDALCEMLENAKMVLKPNGRLVVIAYHSLEDRLVKDYINFGNFLGEPEKDFFGNLIAPFKPLTRKPITASEAELDANPRSRSAKLRIATKL